MRDNPYNLSSDVLYADIREDYNKFDLIMLAIADWGNSLSDKTIKIIKRISACVFGVFLVRIGAGFILGRGEA